MLFANISFDLKVSCIFIYSMLPYFLWGREVRMFSSLIVLFGSLQTIFASKSIELQSSRITIRWDSLMSYMYCLEKNTDCIDGDTGKTHIVGDVWKVDGKCVQKKCKKEDEGVSIQSFGLVARVWALILPRQFYLLSDISWWLPVYFTHDQWFLKFTNWRTFYKMFHCTEEKSKL